MLNICKVLTILCLLCLCGNREYPSSFQNKSVSSSSKWVSKGSERKGLFGVVKHRFFLYTISYMWDKVNYYKSVYHPIPNLPVIIGNTLEIFKANQSALLSIECPNIFSSWPNWREEKALFWRVQEEGPHCEITPKSTWLS